MKLFIINNIDVIITFISIIVTWTLGFLAKKSKYIKTNIIPIQNVGIMIGACLIYYLATGDFSMVVASGSPVATLIYDTIHSLKKEV